MSEYHRAGIPHPVRTHHPIDDLIPSARAGEKIFILGEPSTTMGLMSRVEEHHGLMSTSGDTVVYANPLVYPVGDGEIVIHGPIENQDGRAPYVDPHYDSHTHHRADDLRPVKPDERRARALDALGEAMIAWEQRLDDTNDVLSSTRDFAEDILNILSREVDMEKTGDQQEEGGYYRCRNCQHG